MSVPTDLPDAVLRYAEHEDGLVDVHPSAFATHVTYAVRR